MKFISRGLPDRCVNDTTCMPSSVSISLATNYTTIISLEYKTKNKNNQRNHFMLRLGAGRGGCQDNSFVMYGRLLLSYLWVRQGICLRSLVGFFVLVDFPSSLDSTTNHLLNRSLLDAFLAKLFISNILLCLSVFKLACFRACS